MSWQKKCIDDLTLRRADKSHTVVAMKQVDYLLKLIDFFNSGDFEVLKQALTEEF